MEARQTNGEDQPQKDAAAEPTPNGWEEEEDLQQQQEEEEEGWSGTTSFGDGAAAWDFGSDPEDEEDEEQDIQFLSLSSSFESGSFYARLDEGEGLEEGEQPYTGHYQPLPQQEEDENQQHDKEEEDEEATACPQLEAEACTEEEHEEQEQQEEAEEEAEGFGLPTQSFEPEEDLFTNGNNKKKGVWPLSSAPLTKEKEEERVAKAYRRFEESYAAELGLQYHHQPQQEGVGTTQEATSSLLAGEQVQSIKEAMKGFSLSYTPPWALNVPEHAWHQLLCNALNPGHTSSPNGIALASSPSSSPSSSDEAEEACPSNNNRNEA
ncbi:Latrophilin Cirl [Balamuthia mandrillaris]